MTFREAFVAAVSRLATGSVPTETPELDARVLLGLAAKLSHAGLLARWSETMDDEIYRQFEAALERRRAGEPVAWITGFKEFLGMDFEVGPGLLVPRADTETLVEAALEVIAGQQGATKIVDVCTGTGCVAIGLAALAPRALEVWAGDLSPLAVETSRRNAARLLPSGRLVTVVESNLMAALPGRWDVVLSNPPYLTTLETSDRVGLGWREPALALDGGADGLELVRRLIAQAAATLNPGGWLLIEAADAQMEAIGALFSAAGLSGYRVWSDLAGQRRVAGAQAATIPIG